MFIYVMNLHAKTEALRDKYTFGMMQNLVLYNTDRFQGKSARLPEYIYRTTFVQSYPFPSTPAYAHFQTKPKSYHHP
jgi:hypothetical protein